MKIKRENNDGSMFGLVHGGVTGSAMWYFCQLFPLICVFGILVLHCRLEIAELGEAMIKPFRNSVETETQILIVNCEMLKLFKYFW